MAKKSMFSGEEFKTSRCRLSFAFKLFSPRAQANAKPKYGCTLIFPKSERKALEAKVAEAIKGEWGDKGIEMAKSGIIKNPVLSGDGKEARNKETGEFHPGMGPDVVFIRTQARAVDDNGNKVRPPAVRWRDKDFQESEGNVYSGCYGKAVVNAFTWEFEANGKGVSFGIAMFQKLEEGERIGGRGPVDANKYVETIEDAGEAPDSTKGGDGAAGLFGG